MIEFAIFANGIFWGTSVSETAAAAVQAIADEHGTVDVGQTQASIEGMTAKPVSECLDDELMVA